MIDDGLRRVYDVVLHRNPGETEFHESVRALRTWADREGHDLQVGLSLGRGVKGFSLWHAIRVRASELFPGVRYRSRPCCTSPPSA